MRATVWMSIIVLGACAGERPAHDPEPPAASEQGAAEPDVPPAPDEQAAGPAPCTEAWFERVEDAFPVSDAQGHGPDLGSPEWMRALSHQQKLKVQDLGEPGSEAWCEAVDRALFAR